MAGEGQGPSYVSGEESTVEVRITFSSCCFLKCQGDIFAVGTRGAEHYMLK
jgi:hypothetical protein